tara:strand:+ start:48 stop:869 length:822 start_codon:yes stop_codon:yes gene_type:complete
MLKTRNKSYTNTLGIIKKMNRILILLFSIIIIGCCNQQKLLNNGLTKKADKTTIYFINIRRDSLNIKIQDTVSIIENKYNSNDKISYLTQNPLFTNEQMEIEYIYDEFNKIKKEVGKISTDSVMFTINYFYKDSLLLNTKSETKNDIFHMKQIGKYEYNSDKTLKQTSLLNQYIDIESNDTIANTIEISKYDNKELITESKLSDFIKPERNTNSKYEYKCGILKIIKEFNDKDSLISKTEYKYKFDKFKNWIIRESFENGKLEYIKSRKIEYK